jgi:hypothetical protein
LYEQWATVTRNRRGDPLPPRAPTFFLGEKEMEMDEMTIRGSHETTFRFDENDFLMIDQGENGCVSLSPEQYRQLVDFICDALGI